MMADWERSEGFENWYGCLNCGHYRAMRCIAYPDRIPFAIASGQVDHFVPRPGQVGDTVFTPFDVKVFRETRQRVPERSSSEVTRAG